MGAPGINARCPRQTNSCTHAVARDVVAGCQVPACPVGDGVEGGTRSGRHLDVPWRALRLQATAVTHGTPAPLLSAPRPTFPGARRPDRVIDLSLQAMTPISSGESAQRYSTSRRDPA